ncbi:MAG: hypothetical protein ACTS3T_21330 [Almyronema sp.]
MRIFAGGVAGITLGQAFTASGHTAYIPPYSKGDRAVLSRLLNFLNL